ncbi:MAG: hypothetical protein M3Q48_18040 [Actinomycetota bacterium]|nr:hypothetical protein [Actinomycetota bacterium]
MERSGVTPRTSVVSPELTELVAAPGPFATVYLTTESAVDNAAYHSEQRWRSLRGELAEAGATEEILGAVDPLVPDAHQEGKCLGVVAGAGILHVEHDADPPRRDMVRWATLPSLVPLLEWRQARPPHVVVVTDRRGADLVVVRRELPDVQREAGGADDPIARSSPGGWSQRRFQERAENTWEHNADDVAREITRLAMATAARLVVVAGDVRAVQLLRDALPEEVATIVEVVPGSRSVDSSFGGIADDVAAAVEAAVAADTDALLAKFREELGQADRAVDGAVATLEALAMGRVEVLLVHDDPDDARTAWFGQEPTQVGANADTVAAFGAAPPVEGRLVDVAVAAALRTGAGIRVVPTPDWPREGLGAILRWGG